jgi:hypothetical protein
MITIMRDTLVIFEASALEAISRSEWISLNGDYTKSPLSGYILHNFVLKLNLRAFRWQRQKLDHVRNERNEGNERNEHNEHNEHIHRYFNLSSSKLYIVSFISYLYV